MEAKWLEDFLSLAESRSFSRAAHDRHLTQSALSRRIAALEAWLGAQLIDRSVSPIRLTSTGIMFRGQAAEILRGIYAARTLAHGHELVADGVEVVRMSVVHPLLFTLVPNQLRQIRAELGHVKAKVQAVNVPDGVRAMVEGETDLFLAYHHPHLPIVLDPNRFPFLSLGSERFIPVSAVGPNDGPLFQLPGDSAEPVPFMAYAPGTFLGNVVEMLLLNASRPCALQRVFETHLSEAVKAMVVAGNGLGWLPENSIAREMREKSMTFAGGEQWTTQLEICVYRSSDTQNAAADELWGWLAKSAASNHP
ncbi:LysR family transcriptional regulator [Paraburkholderia sp. Ac-20342]|uniref:LysR substrate-binding domain-containing protein n=1 Tax=Paraburkholderia sp. Ac-20342 TaxID=2703889 RepID=UPI001980D5A1|nr:LysR family transcriptional regulator [Paraburkholderia sp. Ac-20342]MBN3846136.1 LysR family transcriptional regulator [Paraburkholderia sp. Ac-20342]